MLKGIWLQKNEIEYPAEYDDKATPIKDPDLKYWITKRRSEPLFCKLKIVNVGSSAKGNSVVPVEWHTRAALLCCRTGRERAP